MQRVEQELRRARVGALGRSARLATWAATALGVGAMVLSLLVLLPALINGVGGQRAGAANLYVAWFMSLMTFLTFGLIVMLPLTLLIVVCWAVIARRVPQLDQTLAGVLMGAAVPSLAIALVAWTIKRGGDGGGSTLFPSALFLACWLGLSIPRWCIAYLRPGALLFTTEDNTSPRLDPPA